jgi:hypothetical protein
MKKLSIGQVQRVAGYRMSPAAGLSPRLSEAPLRLSKNKIEYLSDRILHLLQEHPRIHPSDNVDLVTRAIDDAIFENMRAEEEIDREVQSIVAENKNEISANEMDVGALRNKLKRELARKKGFTL